MSFDLYPDILTTRINIVANNWRHRYDAVMLK